MQSDKATVVFMGTPGFSVPSLEAIHKDGRFDIKLVVTQPDKPRGRGKKLSPTPVRMKAEELSLPVAIKGKGDYKKIFSMVSGVKPDFIVVVAFGMILKKDLLEVPEHDCVNLHASLLPKYRGVSPIPAAVLSGDAVTGCTTISMDEGIDTGPILLQESVAVDGKDTSGTLAEKLSRVGADLLVETLCGILDGNIEPRVQDEALSSYTTKIRKEDGLIDWGKDAEYLERFVRAMSPWPSAFTFFNGKRVIILEAAIPDAATGGGIPGEVLSSKPLVISCGRGALEMVRLKIQGRRALPSGDFVSGYRVKKSDRFGA